MIYINTRPEQQQLIHALASSPIDVQHYPMLVIEAIPAEQYQSELAARWPSVDKVIFVSPSAVEHGHEVLQTLWAQRKSTLSVYAVGQSTAERAAVALGCEVTAPQTHFSSEALLALPELEHVDNQSILIIGAEGGRRHLQDVLKERGAEISELFVYRRLVPEATKPLPEASATVICTSSEAMRNFFELYPDVGQNKKNPLQWLVSSARLKQIATESYGIPPELIKIIDNASNDAIAAYLIRERV